MGKTELSLTIIIFFCCHGNPADSSPVDQGQQLTKILSRQVRQALPISSLSLEPRYFLSHTQRISGLPSGIARVATTFSHPLSLRGRRRNSLMRRVPQYQPDRVSAGRNRAVRPRPNTARRSSAAKRSGTASRPNIATRSTTALRSIAAPRSNAAPKPNATPRPNAAPRSSAASKPNIAPRSDKIIEITPITWPSNKTVSIPVNLRRRQQVRMRNTTSKRRPQSPSLGNSLTNTEERQRFVSRMRYTPRIRQVPANVSRDHTELLGRYASLRSPRRNFRNPVPRGRGVASYRQVGLTPPSLRRRPPPRTAAGHAHALPPSSGMRPARARTPSKQPDTRLKPVTKLKDKPKPYPKAATTKVGKHNKTSTADVATTNLSPHDTVYNGSDLALELNTTLRQYGLDVDGLIALLQESKGVKQGKGTAATPGGEKQGVPAASGGKNTSQTRILTDLSNELRDITRLLEGGTGGGAKVQTAHVAPPSTTGTTNAPTQVNLPVQANMPPLLESTGNPVMDEMVLQMLLGTLGVSAR